MREDHVGDRVDQYELTELLARSGMASIFKARDTESGAVVVLKIPHMQFESDVVFFERFRREEEIGQRLSHPNIIRVLTPRNKSRMYLVMEYSPGTALRARLSEQCPFPTNQALAIARQLAEALAYMHEHGVVHRDLKPENILVTDDGQVKILDFGIALDKAARRLTWAGLSSTIGTPDYMAPEQIGGRRGDARTDVYALGTMLYEMLTGQLPFDQSNAHAMMRAKTIDDPRPPSYFKPDIDPALETIILKAIQRRPRDRYDDAAELLADLRNPAAVSARGTSGQAGAARRRRVPRELILALVILGILSGLGVLVWLTSRRATEAPAAPTPAPRRR
jgi:eukaryotic-like serine/threonine-protein kinase